MKKILRQVNDFINDYPMVAIGIVCGIFGAIWYFFLRKKDDSKLDVPRSSLNLRSPLTIYKQIADRLEQTIHTVRDDELGQIELLEKLNKDELIEVYNQFGLRRLVMRDQTYLHLDATDLIHWLKFSRNEDEEMEMSKIWEPTGLWR